MTLSFGKSIGQESPFHDLVDGFRAVLPCDAADADACGGFVDGLAGEGEIFHAEDGVAR